MSNLCTAPREYPPLAATRESLCTAMKAQHSHAYMPSLQSCPTLCGPMDCSLPGSSVHADSPGKEPGVGYHALLQRSSQLRGRTCVSCSSSLVGGFFTTGEAPAQPKINKYHLKNRKKRIKQQMKQRVQLGKRDT